MVTESSEINGNAKHDHPQETEERGGSTINTISVPVKTCRNCRETFVNGYHGAVGMGGIVYWAMRGRGERCPKCKKREFSVRYYSLFLGGASEIETDSATTSMISERNPPTAVRSSPPIAQQEPTKHCRFCGGGLPIDALYCEHCGKRLN